MTFNIVSVVWFAYISSIWKAGNDKLFNKWFPLIIWLNL